MSRLVNDLMQKGYLRSGRIIDAFSKIHRLEFVPEELFSQSEADVSLPIGYGQTISQPLTVAFMLELLDPQLNQNVLDLGSGSGWTTCLLAYIVGEKGRVTAVEIIKELCEMGKINIEKFSSFKKGATEFYCQSVESGFEKNAPYDRILVGASVEKIPLLFKKQLKIGGKMVIPIFNDICYVEKRGEDDFYVEKFGGFSFVPFVLNDE
jgi:protein-L-isoaspartate(D-aspartate) O-methyltransferase